MPAKAEREACAGGGGEEAAEEKSAGSRRGRQLKKVLDIIKWSVVYTVVARAAGRTVEERLQMMTNLSTAKRALTSRSAVVWQPSARYQGAAGRAGCMSSSTSVLGGGLIQRHAFRLEGVALEDRRRNQS